jgi:hypothetical protein
LSLMAARGEWQAMPALISDEILSAFMTEADTARGLADALKARYGSLAERLTLYIPFAPGEKDAWWRELLEAFSTP